MAAACGSDFHCAIEGPHFPGRWTAGISRRRLPGVCVPQEGFHDRSCVWANFAGVAELVDALALGASGAILGGSSPSARTKILVGLSSFFILIF